MRRKTPFDVRVLTCESVGSCANALILASGSGKSGPRCWHSGPGSAGPHIPARRAHSAAPWRSSAIHLHCLRTDRRALGLLPFLSLREKQQQRSGINLGGDDTVERSQLLALVLRFSVRLAPGGPSGSSHLSSPSLQGSAVCVRKAGDVTDQDCRPLGAPVKPIVAACSCRVRGWCMRQGC